MTFMELGTNLESLEALWFESERAARVALVEIKRLEGAETPTLLEAAVTRFDAAQARKRQIMSEIEKLEDALIA